MAVYNGEQFVRAQLESILSQLTDDDEVIIVDDTSHDRSVEIIQSLRDPRITLFFNEKNRGVVKSFERALSEASGDIIFLSDQDDVWMPDKVRTIRNALDSPQVLGVVSDAVVVGPDLEVIHESLFALRNSGPGLLKNFYKNSFVGCCMALKKEAKKYILPFPSCVTMHDEWIGCALSYHGQVVFIPQPLLQYRRHQTTATDLFHVSSIRYIVVKRIKMVCMMIQTIVRGKG
jgi:glycosyltransferase involved in cell wall biosynthesis